MTTEQFASLAATTLNGGMDNVQTTCTVVSATLFPSSPQYRIQIDSELLLVTAGAGTTTWTVTRGIEGSTAASHVSGSRVTHVLTAAALGGQSDPAAGIPGLRSLGTGAQQAAAGTEVTRALAAEALKARTFVLNVKDYGAVGDGSTDDTSAINAAITAANSGGGSGQGNRIYFPAGVYVVSSMITVPTQVVLQGAVGRQASVILAKNTFDFGANKAVVSLGAPGGGGAFGCRIEEIGIDANNISGSIACYSDSCEEQAGFFGMHIKNFCKYGIFIEQAGQSGHVAQNWGASRLGLTCSATPDTNAIGLYVRGNATNFRTISDVTSIISGIPSPTSGNQTSYKNVVLEGVNGGTLQDIHLESGTVGVHLANNTLGAVDGTTVYNNTNVRLIGISGHKDNCTDLVRIDNLSTTAKIFSYFIENLVKPGGGTSLHTITDSISNRVVDDNNLGYYFLSNPLANTATSQIVTDSANVGTMFRNTAIDAVALGNTAYSTIRPYEANATLTATSGTLFLFGVTLPAGFVVNKIAFRTGATAATLGSNNDSHWYCAIYNQAGALQCSTADQTTGAIAASTNFDIAIARNASNGASSTWVVPSIGHYLLGFMIYLGTGGVPVAPNINARTAPATGGLNGIISSIQTFNATGGTALTSGTPSTSVTVTAAANNVPLLLVH